MSETQADPREENSPRLLWPVQQMFVDEGLMPLVHRSCSENHHRTVTGVFEAAHLPHHRNFDLAVNPDLDRRRLADVLRLNQYNIDERCYDLVEGTGSTPLRSFFKAKVAAYDLKFRRRTVSCRALAIANYHRAIWQHGLVPFCHETGEWLIEECPRCGRRLDWYYSNGASLCDNKECGFDLRDFCGLRVDDERFQLVAPIVRLLDPRPDIHGEAMVRLPTAFEQIGRGAAFELIWRIGRWTTPGGMNARDEHSLLSADDIVETWCRASSMLDEWPQSVAAFMQDAARLVGPESAFRLSKSLRAIVRGRTAWEGHRQVIEQAVPELLGSDRHTFLSLNGDGANAAEATRILGISASNLVCLARKGMVRAQADRGSTYVYAIYSRHELQSLACDFKDRMPISAASEQLGITAHGVEQLMCLGVLTSLNTPCVQEVYPGLNLSRTSFSAFLAKMEQGVCSDVSSDPDAVPLRRAMIVFGGREKPWGPIIAAMLEGNLKYGLVIPGRGIAGRVVIAPSDLVRIAAMTFNRADFDFPFSNVITRRDAQETLNLTPALMTRALQSELAPAAVNGGKLALQPVLQLARSRISGGEVLARWGRGRRLPRPLRDARRFPRLGATGWRRSDVEIAMEDLVGADRKWTEIQKRRRR